MGLKDAFNSLLSLHKRTVTIERPGSPGISAVTIKATPSNYGRNLAAPEEVVVFGREFIISKKVLDEVSFPRPKRADIITDTESGRFVISEVTEMFDFGGEIMGYRVRTS